MTAIFTSILSLLQPSIPTLLTNPHASPPLRLLFLVCTPSRLLPSLTAQSSKGDLFRSKKSGKYRKSHGVQGKSIFDAQASQTAGAGEQGGNRKVPCEVLEKRREVTSGLLSAISEIEWRSMGINEVGSAALQLLVDLEIEDGRSMTSGSLLDHLTEGLLTRLREFLEFFCRLLQQTSFKTQNHPLPLYQRTIQHLFCPCQLARGYSRHLSKSPRHPSSKLSGVCTSKGRSVN